MIFWKLIFTLAFIFNPSIGPPPPSIGLPPTSTGPSPPPSLHGSNMHLFTVYESFSVYTSLISLIFHPWPDISIEIYPTAQTYLIQAHLQYHLTHAQMPRTTFPAFSRFHSRKAQVANTMNNGSPATCFLIPVFYCLV